MKLDFNKELHEYRIDGVKVVSVTEVLKREGFIDFSHVHPSTLAAASCFGKAGHLATALYDLDDLDYSTLSKPLEPYLDGWIKFKKDTGIIIDKEWIEKPIASKRLMLAGTPDRNRCIYRDRLAIVEIKFVSVFAKATVLQLEGYEVIENEGKKFKDKIKETIGVNLRGDGTYQLLPKKCYGKINRTIFLGALNNLRWKEANL